MGIKIIKDLGMGRDGFFTRELNTCLSIPQKPYQRGNVIRPSDISECTRRIVCDILGFPLNDIIQPQHQRIFDNGNYVHKRYLKNYIQRMGCVSRVYDADGKVHDFVDFLLTDPSFWLRAKPDAVIFNKEDGLPYVLELKSVKQETFNELQQPEWAHVAQVHIYMFLTGINRSIVLYENKNNQDIKEFTVLLDHNVLNSLLTKIKTIQNYVLQYPETKKLPECECSSYNQCRKYEVPA